MAQYFTVHLERECRVSVYDKLGNFVDERIDRLPQSYRDLPYTTAMSYKSAFPDANVRIEAQDGLSGVGPSVGASHASAGQKRASGAQSSKPRASAPSPAASHSTGTYAALVNEMAKDSA